MDLVPLHLLHAFVVFNDSPNITLAAQRLGLTQPALSKQLKQLEVRVQLKLFILRGRKKVLTPLGRELNDRLSARIADLPALVEQVIKVRATSPQNLRLVGRRGLLDRVAGQLNHPGTVEFVEASNEQVIAMLMSMKADLGIAHHVPDSHELAAKPLFTEQFHLVIPKKWFPRPPRLGRKLTAELARHPCLAYKPNDEILKALMTTNHNQLRPTRITDNYQSLAEMVKAHRGWTVLPSYLPVSAQQNWILPLPERIVPRRLFYLVYRTEFASSLWLKELRVEMERCFKV